MCNYVGRQATVKLHQSTTTAFTLRAFPVAAGRFNVWRRATLRAPPGPLPFLILLFNTPRRGPPPFGDVCDQTTTTVVNYYHEPAAATAREGPTHSFARCASPHALATLHHRRRPFRNTHDGALFFLFLFFFIFPTPPRAYRDLFVDVRWTAAAVTVFSYLSADDGLGKIL